LRRRSVGSMKTTRSPISWYSERQFEFGCRAARTL
jgi:hypothetical protein